MDDNKDFQATISNFKFDDDKISCYSLNNNVYNFENQNKLIFVPKNKIKCEKKCFDIVNKWITRVIIETPTGNNINNIITREIMMLKVKYPFLPIQQLQGKALVKFKIPNLMGNIVRTAVAKRKITEDIVKKFLSPKIAKKQVLTGIKNCKEFVSLENFKTLNIDNMCDNLLITPKKNGAYNRKRKIFSPITNINFYNNEIFSSKKRKFGENLNNPSSPFVFSENNKNINIEHSYIKTSKTNVDERIKTCVECSPITQNYLKSHLSNQLEQINLNTNNNIESSKENIKFEKNLSNKNNFNDYNINEEIKSDNSDLQQTSKFCQNIRTYAECSPFTKNNNGTINNSDQTTGILEKYIPECSSIIIDTEKNFRGSVLNYSNYRQNNQPSFILNNQQNGKKNEKIYLFDTISNDDEDFQSTSFSKEEIPYSIIQEHNYIGSNFNTPIFSKTSLPFSCVSLSSRTSTFSISTNSFRSQMSGNCSDFNRKLQLSPVNNFLSSPINLTQKSDNFISPREFYINYHTFDESNENINKTNMVDCLLLSNVCCEYDDIEKKIACSPQIIDLSHNNKYEYNSKNININEIQELIDKNLKYLEQHCN